jgi:uncharacterized protein involved in type VI secretion and phage assembly
MSPPEALSRDAAVESGGHAKGVAVAVVSDNRDDTGQGRVRVSYPWHSQPRESHWARVAVLMAGSQRGTYFIPEVGDEVLVAFERGDVRFPYVIGCLWNGRDKAPATNGDGNNDLRIIHTRSGHKLTFNDGAQGKVQLELSDGKRLTFDDQGVELDDGQGNKLKFQSSGGAVTLEAATRLTLKAPQISLESTQRASVSGGGELTLSAAMVRIN